MDRVTLGRTGLSVGVAGLGCGGASRLGLPRDGSGSFDDAVNLVRTALDEGVNYFDTARQYGTEGVVGRAVDGRRDAAVISTKVSPRPRGGGDLIDGKGIRTSVETSLGQLGTDWVDIFHLHGVTIGDYAYSADELVPALLAMREDGLVRFIGLSEDFRNDVTHEMLGVALQDRWWDVAMLGFNILNPSARKRVLPEAIAANIGIEVMYGVRTVLSRPEALRHAIADCVTSGLIDPESIDLDDPLGFLVHEGGATSVIDAAYRFARHEPGTHVVLTGTGSITHLRENLASINRPPLPEEDQTRLAELFGHLAHLAGN